MKEERKEQTRGTRQREIRPSKLSGSSHSGAMVLTSDHPGDTVKIGVHIVNVKSVGGDSVVNGRSSEAR